MDPVEDVFVAIMTKLASTSFWNDVGGRVFLDEAPPGTLIFPYAVFSLVSDVPEKTFTEDLEDMLIQFSLFSASTGKAEIAGMYADLKSAFSTGTIEECKLTLTGSTMIWMKRMNLVTMTEDIPQADGSSNQVKHWAVDYAILTSLN